MQPNSFSQNYGFDPFDFLFRLWIWYFGIFTSPSTSIPIPFCHFGIKSYLTGITWLVSIVFIYRAALATTERGEDFVK